jgi:aspartyl-tRNA(Asn)/glutamyl-tRNA(Gln) amidotransferase subunit B
VERFIQKYKIDEASAQVLSSNLDLANFFEKIASKVSSELAARWVTVELLRVLNWNKKELKQVDIKPEHFLELLKLIQEKKISELAAKQMLNDFGTKSFSPSEKIKKSKMIYNKEDIEKICNEIIRKNEKAVEDYKSGKEEALKFLIGQVIEKTQRRANPKIVYETLKRLIS